MYQGYDPRATAERLSSAAARVRAHGDATPSTPSKSTWEAFTAMRCAWPGRPEPAEDLTQETMLRGWRDRERLREPRAARVWLLRIATQLVERRITKGKVSHANAGRGAALLSRAAQR